MNNLNADLATMPRRRTYIRASEMPVVDKCPAAHWEITDPDLVRNSPGEAAETGTRVHELLAEAVCGERPDVEGEPDSVKIPFYRGLRMWEHARPYFERDGAEVETEVKADSPLIHARIDLVAWCAESRVLHVGDWKTGYVIRDYAAQLAAGALSYLDTRDKPLEPDLVVLWSFDVNEDFIEEPAQFVPGDIYAVAERWARAVKHAREGTQPSPAEYRPGAQCEACPASSRCPAVHGQMRPFVALMRETEPKAVAESQSPEEIEKARTLITELERWLDGYKSALRSRVEAEGGIHLPSSGKWLVMKEERRKKFDAGGVWAYLSRTKGLAPQDILRALKVSSTELERVIGEQAQPMEKGKTIKAWREELEAFGALKYVPAKKLGESRVPPQIEDGGEGEE